MEHAQNQYNITLTKEQQKQVIELVAKQKTSREIAAILKVSPMKMWRNMKLMGLNANKQPQKSHKRNCVNKETINDVLEVNEVFNCNFHAFAF